jgi:NADPH:quinone reductase-like Zn-dependent oxidoreductase
MSFRESLTESPLFKARRILKPDGICVQAGLGGAGSQTQALGRIAAAFVASSRSHKFARYGTRFDRDLKFLSDLMAENKVTPFVEKTYRFTETAEALRYFQQGHSRGKIVITVK